MGAGSAGPCLDAPAGERAVASITFWQVAMLAARRRIAVDVPPREWRRRILGLGADDRILGWGGPCDVAMRAGRQLA